MDGCEFVFVVLAGDTCHPIAENSDPLKNVPGPAGDASN